MKSAFYHRPPACLLLTDQTNHIGTKESNKSDDSIAAHCSVGDDELNEDAGLSSVIHHDAEHVMMMCRTNKALRYGASHMKELKKELGTLRECFYNLKNEGDPLRLKAFQRLTQLLLKVILSAVNEDENYKCEISSPHLSHTLSVFKRIPELLAAVELTITDCGNPMPIFEKFCTELRTAIGSKPLMNRVNVGHLRCQIDGSEFPFEHQKQILEKIAKIEAPADLKYLAFVTGDESWINLTRWWKKAPLSLRWLCLATDRRDWLAYCDLYCCSSEDLRWAAVDNGDPRWLHFESSWKFLSLKNRINALRCRDFHHLRTADFANSSRFELMDCALSEWHYLVPIELKKSPCQNITSILNRCVCCPIHCREATLLSEHKRLGLLDLEELRILAEYVDNALANQKGSGTQSETEKLWEARLRGKESEIQELSSKLAAMEEKLQHTETDFAEKSKASADDLTRLREALNLKSVELSELARKLRIGADGVAEKERLVKSKDSAINEKDNRISALDRELGEAKERTGLLEKSLKESEGKLGRVTELEDQLRSREADCGKLQTDLKTKDSQMKVLESDLSYRISQVKSLESETKGGTELEKLLANSEKEIEMLRTEAQRHLNDLSEARKENAQLARDLESLKTKADEQRETEPEPKQPSPPMVKTLVKMAKSPPSMTPPKLPPPKPPAKLVSPPKPMPPKKPPPSKMVSPLIQRVVSNSNLPLEKKPTMDDIRAMAVSASEQSMTPFIDNEEDSANKPPDSA